LPKKKFGETRVERDEEGTYCDLIGPRKRGVCMKKKTSTGDFKKGYRKGPSFLMRR